jgi:hypothetical protein
MKPRYVLDDGVDRADLTPSALAEYDRLLADPAGQPLSRPIRPIGA